MQNTAIKKSNLSPILFAGGLITAALLATGLDHSGRFFVRSGNSQLAAQADSLVPLRSEFIFSEDDKSAANVAWQYIQMNTRPETGFVDSVAGFPSTTLWDQGSYLLGLVSALQLGVVGTEEFERRISNLLGGFERIPLVNGKLPNKVYNTVDLSMTDYGNNPVPDGLGWSALDIARMLLAFRILERHAPEFGPRLRVLIGRWSLEELSRDGELVGTSRNDQGLVHLQEGRIGYEQYGARSAAMWGVDVSQSISARRIMEWRDVSGVQIAVDLRRAAGFGAITPVLNEPYMLSGLELGFGADGHAFASQIYHAQAQRYRETGLLTAVSEDHIDESPSFLYSSVFSNGRDWAVVDEHGTHYEELRTLSTKASFALDALFANDHTNLLREEVASLADPAQGWPAGLYEIDGSANEIYTLNTNGIVLEALHFKAFGPLWKVR